MFILRYLQPLHLFHIHFLLCFVSNQKICFLFFPILSQLPNRNNQPTDNLHLLLPDENKFQTIIEKIKQEIVKMDENYGVQHQIVGS